MTGALRDAVDRAQVLGELAAGLRGVARIAVLPAGLGPAEIAVIEEVAARMAAMRHLRVRLPRLGPDDRAGGLGAAAVILADIASPEDADG